LAVSCRASESSASSAPVLLTVGNSALPLTTSAGDCGSVTRTSNAEFGAIVFVVVSDENT
jgi:hypothetical protein